MFNTEYDVFGATILFYMDEKNLSPDADPYVLTRVIGIQNVSLGYFFDHSETIYNVWGHSEHAPQTKSHRRLLYLCTTTLRSLHCHQP